MEMPDFDPTASAQYVRYARGTHVPNGAKPHGPAAYSRVLPLNRLGTASTSSRRDLSASSRHGPSLAHIRAGTDRHGAVSAIAKRATAKLGTHACQPQMAAALSSPAPAQMWPPGLAQAHQGPTVERFAHAKAHVGVARLIAVVFLRLLAALFDVIAIHAIAKRFEAWCGPIAAGSTLA